MFAGSVDHDGDSSAIPSENGDVPPRGQKYQRNRRRSEGGAGTDPTRDWRQRKLRGLAIAEAYDRLGLLHAKKAERLRNCGTYQEYGVHELPDGSLLRQLVRINSCKGRMCPTCQRIKSLSLFHQLKELVCEAVQRRPKDQALLVTLTTKNVPGEALSGEIDRQLAAFKKLIRRKAMACVVTGWWRTLEVSRNPVTGEFHAHIHVLLFVRPEYFRRASGLYIDQKNHEWGKLWQACLGVDYVPHVDVRQVKGVGGGRLTEAGRKALLEVTKYVTKPGTLCELVDDRWHVDAEVLRAVDFAVDGRRLVSMGGILRTIAHELNQPDPDSHAELTYTVETLPEGAVYIGRERYGWVDGKRPGEGYFRLLEWPWVWDGDQHCFNARDGTRYSGEWLDA